MVGLAGALVLNIGTLSPHWVEAMLARRPRGERARRAGRARPGRRRRDALPHRDGEADPRRGRRRGAARQRGRGGDARRRRGRGARRRVDRRRRRSGRARARGGAHARRRRVGHRPGRPRLRRRRACSRSRTATRCSRRSPARAACRARSPAASSPSPESPLDARGRGARRVRRRGRGRGRRTRRARARSTSRSTTRSPALDPATLDGAGEGLVRVHAIVGDLETARRAVEAGATVVQLRVKAPTAEVVARGRGFGELGVTFVVNDDVDAALELGADGVHLGQSRRGRGARAGARACCSAARRSRSSRRVEADADYLGVGPIWETPSKDDADPPLGLDELARICARGLGAGRRDRRHRRVERRRVHPRRRGRRRGRSARRPIPALRRAVDEALAAR